LPVEQKRGHPNPKCSIYIGHDYMYRPNLSYTYITTFRMTIDSV